MRILLLTPLYPPAGGGASIYFSHIVPLLSKNPAIEKIVLLTEIMPGEPEEMGEGKLTIFRKLPRRVSERRPSIIHALTYLQTQLWIQQKLPKLVKTNHIDLIHFHTRFRGNLFYQTLANLPVPVLADLRDKMSHPANLAQSSQHLLCCSQGVLHFAKKGGYPSSRMSYVPIPFKPPPTVSTQMVSATRAHFGLGKRPFLLFLGDVTPNKGVYQLLGAVERWQQVVPGIDLVIAGTNRVGETFVNRVNEANGVCFLGHIPHQQAMILLQASEMLLLPSKSEGLPRAILEAIWFGKKVLCPPNIPEFDTHLPNFVLPEVSPEAIFQTLNKVWKTPYIPNYPLEDHELPGIVNKIVATYQKMTQGN